MKKIKCGDEVIILTGKDKGKIATVKQFENADQVLIQGVNIVKKHVKPDPNKGVIGGIIGFEKPIHISNVAIYNASTKKADRIGFRISDDNKKIRYYKSTGEPVTSK
ncbi:MAG: 50S ribosomal protein L24 [Nitrosomonas sp.]|jgi:large subunit ribosomal protein L24|nr:MAG: 50S ribosomal protein L24 [Nitrosomonas sp.]HMU65093.1 50S ribosomal protein L24 [Nitrosomonas sp.]HMV12056.1 50S ribosomal protein L24 [Nitrosomonas sp.]HMW20443.1 50S ribosomal protein L24 [Nitrosomonas sp.]HMW68123.1 50S ribosomal protein L24 [Nitrosomonas sp.]